MATIGSMAMTQIRMAQVSTKYGVESSNLFTKSSFETGTSSKTSVNDAMEGILRNKSDYIKEQYTKLYKSIFPDSEESEKAEQTVSVKSAAMKAENSSYDLTNFANSLDFGGEVDTEAAAKKIQNFVDGYNSFIGAVGESDNQSVLQKGVVMVNTAKVYSSALGRAGITVGSDNKLTFDKDKLNGIKAYELKSTFGTGGFSSKVSQKAAQVERLQGSTGNLFSYSNTVTPSYTYNIGALLSTYA